MTIQTLVLYALVIFLLIALFNKANEYFSILPKDCDKLEVITIDSGKEGLTLGIEAGVHGNEPAGTFTLLKMIRNGEFKPKTGKVVLIPRANQCGLYYNIRYQPGLIPTDLNRKFGENGGMDSKSQQILDAMKECDLVLDFHEGWGWHLETQRRKNFYPLSMISLGSTLSPSSHQLARKIARNALLIINAEIEDELRKFSVLNGESCDIPNTLSCHMEKKNRAHILIETTGQADVQPMIIRERQVRQVIYTTMKEMKLI